MKKDPFRSLPFPSVAQRCTTAGPSVPLLRCTPTPFRGRVHRKGRKANGHNSSRENDPLPLHEQNPLPEEGFWPRVPIAEVADEWVVLRCASAATIELAEELRDEYDVLAWSPVIRVQRRLPRRRKTELIIRPLLPSFTFVARDHADEALDLATRGRVHQCKRFLVNVGEVVVPGVQLTPLHVAQIRGTLRKSPLAPGDRVEILANLLYLAKATVVKGPMRSDTYEVELDGHRQPYVFPGFLLRKLVI